MIQCDNQLTVNKKNTSQVLQDSLYNIKVQK